MSALQLFILLLVWEANTLHSYPIKSRGYSILFIAPMSKNHAPQTVIWKLPERSVGMEVELLWRRPNAPSVALRGGLRLLRLAEFVRYNRAAIGGPSKRQPMNSLVSSCLGSTCYAQTPFARYWSGHQSGSQWTRSYQAASAQLGYAQTPKVINLMYKNKIGEN